MISADDRCNNQSKTERDENTGRHTLPEDSLHEKTCLQQKQDDQALDKTLHLKTPRLRHCFERKNSHGLLLKIFDLKVRSHIIGER